MAGHVKTSKFIAAAMHREVLEELGCDPPCFNPKFLFSCAWKQVISPEGTDLQFN